MDTVSVVFASDLSYLPKTVVSIYSILESRSADYHLDFYILNSQNMKDIEGRTNWKFENYSIEFVNVDESLFEDLVLSIPHISLPTYYRILIPQVLPKLKKCIYMDGDTICCSDIKELFDIELGENYVGGCFGEWIDVSDKNLAKWAERIGVPNGTTYINAGVLLLDVEKMKTRTEMMLNESRKNYPLQDQDVINKCFYGKIEILHPKYNIYSWTSNMYNSGYDFRYDKELIKQAIDAPCIVHYADEYTKPWRNDRCICSELWWDIAKIALSENEVESLQKEMLEYSKEYSGEKLLKLIKRYKKVILFGYGKAGPELKQFIEENFGTDIIDFICDNNKELVGTYKDGLKVCSPHEIKVGDDDYVVIVTSQLYAKPITEQLRKMGISEGQIAVYRYKGDKYKLSISTQV